METQKVNDLSTVTAVDISDYIPILTDEVDNVVEKISIENFVNAGYFEEKIENVVSEQVEELPSVIANTIYNVIYPIGSIYTGTMQECPIPVGTWELRATNIVTDIEDVAPVVGNGMTLGLTNGTGNFGLANFTDIRLGADEHFGSNVGVTSGTATREQKTLGVTTDGTKSGIVANIEKTSLTVNIWERVA